MSFLARGLSNLIGIVVPIVASFKILKKPTNKKLIQATQYWSVYGSFLIIDWFLTTFFVSCFIPFYDFFVLTFTLLMAIPHIGFAGVLYTKFLAPFLRKYERRIDRISGKVVEKIWEKIPGVAATVPAILTSMMAILNETPVPLASLEIDETVEMDCPNEEPVIPMKNVQLLMRTARLNRSFEIQSEDDDDQNLSFEPFPVREVKQEIMDEEEDVFDEIVAPPPRRVGMRTRRQARARSVM